MKIAIYGQNYSKESNQKAFEILLDVLLEQKVDIFIESDFLNQQNEVIRTSSAIKTFIII